MRQPRRPRANDLIDLAIQARRAERFGLSPHEDGEIHYSFYANGTFIGRSAVDVTTKRTLLARLFELTNLCASKGWDDASLQKLRNLGQQLFTLVVPDSVRTHVFGGDESRSISFDVQDHDIPWELLHDGEDFVAKRHAMGRRLIRPTPDEPRMRRNIRMAIVGDPTEDLPGAREESERIASHCQAAFDRLADAYEIDSTVVLLQGEEATKDAVLLDLLMNAGEGIDVFHFAGHAHADPLDLDNAGFALSDGKLRPFEARSISSRPLVFANACRASQPLDSSITFGSVSGFASEFIAGGAQAYIGPAWPINDNTAQELAAAFYELVIAGESIGDALLESKRRIDDPDALAYLFFGDVGERLSIFSPDLTAGPYVNDLGIGRIIETERAYPAMELLAVNDLPWILWDLTDILAWTARIPIDRPRQRAAAMSLMEYVEEFGEKIKRREKRFFCILNAKTFSRYLALRGKERWEELAEQLDGFFELEDFTLVLASPQTEEIEEIELVSTSSELPLSFSKSVYVFNKQTRFEQSYLTYNLFEDYNPQMIAHYWGRFADLVKQSLRDYAIPHGDDVFAPSTSSTINRETRSRLHALAAKSLKGSN